MYLLCKIVFSLKKRLPGEKHDSLMEVSIDFVHGCFKIGCLLEPVIAVSLEQPRVCWKPRQLGVEGINFLVKKNL